MEYFKNYLTEKAFTKGLWIGGLALMLVSMVGMAVIFANLGPNVNFKSWPPMFGLTFFDLMNLGMTAIIVSVFVILYKKRRAGNFLQKFIPYGRMALTNYVFQSIVGTFIFFGWGLGLSRKNTEQYSILNRNCHYHRSNVAEQALAETL